MDVLIQPLSNDRQEKWQFKNASVAQSQEAQRFLRAARLQVQEDEKALANYRKGRV